MPQAEVPARNQVGAELPVPGLLGQAGYTIAAWFLLVLADLALRVAGFSRLYRLIRSWPVIGAASPARSAARVRDVGAAVTRARTCYFKHAWCLQRAVAGVCLLRLCGVRAELVIGVRKIPFHAHAWAEIGGVIVDDDPSFCHQHQVIERC